MRAANPQESAEPSADKRSYEPSMEEILASIRRIIADDQSLPARASASATSSASAHHESGTPEPARYEPADDYQASDAASPEAAQSASADNWEHTAPVAIVSDPDPEPVAPPAAPKPFLREAPFAFKAPEAAPEPTPIRPTIAPLPPEATETVEKAPISSAETDAAVGAAFNMLAASRLASSSDEIMSLARDMIRPLLREWIDDNLPSMVERLVRAEIERVARGGR